MHDGCSSGNVNYTILFYGNFTDIRPYAILSVYFNYIILIITFNCVDKEV